MRFNSIRLGCYGFYKRGITATRILWNRSPVTLKQEIYFPYKFRLQKLSVSGFIVLISLGIVVVSIGVLIIFPKMWFKTGVRATIAAALVNLVTILILKMIYGSIAIWLTNFENHKTPTQYEDSLILKTYLFDFFNFYSALFYIMLFKQGYIRQIIPDIESACEYNSCMFELTVQLATILIGRQAIGQFQEIFLPWIRSKLNKESIIEELDALKAIYEKSGRPNKEVPQWAHDERLPPAKGAIRSDYEEMVVQFGFIALFSPAFPLAAFFSWLNNITEIRSDAFKYVVTLQRPVGYQAQTIGLWERIMSVISILAVLTNAIIIAFHSTWMETQFLRFTGDNEAQLIVTRLAFILIFEHVIFAIKLIFSYLITDVPKSVRVAIERESYLVKLTLENEAAALDEYMADQDDSSLFDENGELKLPKKKNNNKMHIKSESSIGDNAGDDGDVVIE